MADRCHGACCREIRQPYGPGQLDAAADAEAAGFSCYIYAGEGHYGLQDAQKLRSMLVPVRREEDGRWLYSCRHLLPNGDCDDYENRPYMCSAFPYGKPCPYPDCTWDQGRHGDGTPTPAPQGAAGEAGE